MGNTEVAGLRKNTMFLKLILSFLIHFGYTLAAPLEEQQAEERSKISYLSSFNDILYRYFGYCGFVFLWCLVPLEISIFKS